MEGENGLLTPVAFVLAHECQQRQSYEGNTPKWRAIVKNIHYIQLIDLTSANAMAMSDQAGMVPGITRWE